MNSHKFISYAVTLKIKGEKNELLNNNLTTWKLVGWKEFCLVSGFSCAQGMTQQASREKMQF